MLGCRSNDFLVTPFHHHSITGSLSQENDAIPAPFERSLNGISKTDANAITDDQTIHHCLDGVPFVLFEANPFGAIQLHDLTINPSTHKSFSPDFFYYVPKLPQLILNQRCQQNDFRLWLVSKDLIDNLLGRFPAQRLARHWIVGLAYSRKEAPQVSMNFRRSRGRRWRISAGAGP